MNCWRTCKKNRRFDPLLHKLFLLAISTSAYGTVGFTWETPAIASKSQCSSEDAWGSPEQTARVKGRRYGTTNKQAACGVAS
jgi:hypothetical protein